jgi:hypothetical protein
MSTREGGLMMRIDREEELPHGVAVHMSKTIRSA